MARFVRRSRRRQKFDGDSRGLGVVGEDSREVALFVVAIDENDFDLAGGKVRGLVKTKAVKGDFRRLEVAIPIAHGEGDLDPFFHPGWDVIRF